MTIDKTIDALAFQLAMRSSAYELEKLIEYRISLCRASETSRQRKSHHRPSASQMNQPKWQRPRPNARGAMPSRRGQMTETARREDG